LFALVIALVAATASSASAAAAPDAPWAATGTATTTATSDGTNGDPVLDYSVVGSSGSWTFSATAKTARQQKIAWHYKGYHAWFQVRVAIERFVIRGGKEIVTEKLAGAGPVNCCVAPSGGFDYTGTASFDLQAGDVYGFRMSGSHFDRDRRLIGTLSLTPEQLAGAADLETMVKAAQARIEARTAQIKKLQTELAAASAAGDTQKAQQLQLQLQDLTRQQLQDIDLLSNLLSKVSATRDQILGNIR
jgi:hypothetical protein